MLAMAWAVEAIGFEPDIEECIRLNGFYADPRNNPFWQTHFFPVALGRDGKGRTLHLTKHRGASSLLRPQPETASAFQRADYVTTERTITLDTVPLDRFLRDNGLGGAVHMKVDVEGLELEILQSAPDLLDSSLLAVDAEVSFMQTRDNQPYYGEIETFLRGCQFIPLGFTELHCWRRLTRSRYPKKVKGPVPFSRGQIIHGNMLFMKKPEAIFAQSSRQILAAAFISMSYGYLDHALFFLQNEAVQEELRNAGINDPAAEIRKVSLTQYRRHRWER